MGRFGETIEVYVWGRSGVLGTKAAISLRRVNIEEKLLWRALGSHQRSFEWCLPDSLLPLTPSPRLEVRNPDLKLESKVAGKRVHRE